MSDLPPVPQASQSPYPIQEPPHEHPAEAVERHHSESNGASSFPGLLDHVRLDTRAAIAIGTVALGIVAGIAALFFAKGGTRSA
jgi:hypothetical protein